MHSKVIFTLLFYLCFLMCTVPLMSKEGEEDETRQSIVTEGHNTVESLFLASPNSSAVNPNLNISAQEKKLEEQQELAQKQIQEKQEIFEKRLEWLHEQDKSVVEPKDCEFPQYGDYLRSSNEKQHSDAVQFFAEQRSLALVKINQYEKQRAQVDWRRIIVSPAIAVITMVLGSGAFGCMFIEDKHRAQVIIGGIGLGGFAGLLIAANEYWGERSRVLEKQKKIDDLQKSWKGSIKDIDDRFRIDRQLPATTSELKITSEKLAQEYMKRYPQYVERYDKREIHNDKSIIASK